MRCRIGCGTGCPMNDLTELRGARRLDPGVRAEQILAEATRFFAERGFEAQLADLAARIGVSEALIFRYYRTKQVLIEAVYDRVFIQRWSEEWITALADRAVPVRARVERFYLSYLEAVDDPLWIRIAMYAALAGERMPVAYGARARVERVLKVILHELHAAGLLPDDPGQEALQWEMVLHLYSSVLYLLLRKHILNRRVTEDRDAMVKRLVANFFAEFERA
ncbi:MAG: TetR/AcrR family transcriptional regulator [Betaproteobacteria bacterium]|nr:TetR/AcrR family transcriptional regulator [Betaproteobacteria bacterium]